MVNEVLVERELAEKEKKTPQSTKEFLLRAMIELINALIRSYRVDRAGLSIVLALSKYVFLRK